MVEYVTKEEVISILRDTQMEAVRAGEEKTVDTVNGIMKQVKRLYAVRDNLPASWMKMRDSGTIYCGSCGYQTMVYRNTAFCPNCGRRMGNGVRKMEGK